MRIAKRKLSVESNVVKGGVYQPRWWWNSSHFVCWLLVAGAFSNCHTMQNESMNIYTASRRVLLFLKLQTPNPSPLILFLMFILFDINESSPKRDHCTNEKKARELVDYYQNRKKAFMLYVHCTSNNIYNIHITTIVGWSNAISKIFYSLRSDFSFVSAISIWNYFGALQSLSFICERIFLYLVCFARSSSHFQQLRSQVDSLWLFFGWVKTKPINKRTNTYLLPT